MNTETVKHICRKCNTPIPEHEHNEYNGLCVTCHYEQKALQRVPDALPLQPAPLGVLTASDAAESLSGALADDTVGKLFMGVDHGAQVSTAVLANMKPDGSIHVLAEGELKDMSAVLREKRRVKRANLTRDQWMDRARQSEMRVKALEAEEVSYFAELTNGHAVEIRELNDAVDDAKKQTVYYSGELAAARRRFKHGYMIATVLGILFGLVLGYLFFAR